MNKRHIVLYLMALPWNLTICWPAVLLIRLFWGKNLRWEKDPSKDSGDGYSLWTDLRPGSWPSRSWYTYKTDGKKTPNPMHLVEKFGPYRTWGGTTLGHGGFYGPGQVTGEWSRLQEHEHIHVEQYEAAMFRSFFTSTVWLIVVLALGHPTAAFITWLVMWWGGYLWMGVANWTTAVLRGEPAYRGSHHEESAYAQDDNWQQGLNEESDG